MSEANFALCLVFTNEMNESSCALCLVFTNKISEANCALCILFTNKISESDCAFCLGFQKPYWLESFSAFSLLLVEFNLNYFVPGFTFKILATVAVKRSKALSSIVFYARKHVHTAHPEHSPNVLLTSHRAL